GPRVPVLDPRRRGGVLGRLPGVLLENRLRAHVRIRAHVPRDLERIARFHGVLVAVRDDGDEVVVHDRPDVTLDALRSAVVHRLVLAALAGGRVGDLRVDHVRQERVDAEFGPAVGLLRDVQTLDPLADDLVLARLLALDLLEVVLRQRPRDGDPRADPTVPHRPPGR